MTDHNPVEISAVVLAENTSVNVESSMNASTRTPGSAVPLSDVGKMLVSDGIVSMVTDGGVESNVNDVELNPVLFAASCTPAKTK